MPPEITAGPLALAGLPPDAAVGVKPAEPPGTRTFSTALFASLLAQPSPPELAGIAARAAAPTLKAKVILNTAPILNANPILIAAQPASKYLKTMDTPPKLAGLPQKDAKAKTSELPSFQALVPSEPAHKMPPEDKPAASPPSASANTPGAPANTPGAPANLPAPAVAAPIAASAALLPASMPASAALLPAPMPASVAAAPPLSRTAAALLPTPAAPPGPPVTVLAPPVEAVTAASSRSSTQEIQPLALMQPALVQSALPAGPGVLMPRAWALPVPASAPAQVGSSAQAESPAQAALTAKTASTALPAAQANADTPAALSEKPSWATAVRGEPRLISLTQPPGPAGLSPSGNSLPAHISALTALNPPQDLAVTQAAPLPASPVFAAFSAAPAAASSLPSLPAPGDPALPAPAPAKPAEKSVQISLKPAAENTDTITSLLPGETAEPAVKVMEPAAASTSAAEPLAFRQQATEPAKTLDAELGTKKAEEPGAALKSFAAPAEAQSSVSPIQTAAAGPSLKPLSAADHAAMVRQVAGGVADMPLPVKPGAAQQMSLQLHPKDWGSLQVSVSVVPGPDAGAAKTVTAHIVAETPQVKAALQSQTPALRQALRASGLNLEHLTVSVKPASETVKAASPGASSGFGSHGSSPSGFSSGQGQASAGGSQTQAGSQAGQTSNASAGNMASGGGRQDTRQGQTLPAPAAAPAEPDEIVMERLPMRPLSGRIDTLA